MKRFPLPYGQRGQSSTVLVIIILVVVFAVMLAGGGGSLFTGNEPSSVTDTPAAGDGSPTASPSASQTNGWNITVTLGSCQQGKSPFISADLKVEGPSDGTVEYLVGTKSIGTQPFTAPNGNYPLNLSNDDGVNNTDWKITVTSGGIVQKTYNGTRTGCQ